MVSISGQDEFGHLGPGSHRVRLADGRYAFVKLRRDRPADFFHAEARGLRALATSPMRVPRVLTVWDGGIALDDLGRGCAGEQAWERAGLGLAQLHGSAGQHFGFAARGWCGDSEQDNTLDSDGFRF